MQFLKIATCICVGDLGGDKPKKTDESILEERKGEDAINDETSGLVTGFLTKKICMIPKGSIKSPFFTSISSRPQFPRERGEGGKNQSILIYLPLEFSPQSLLPFRFPFLHLVILFHSLFPDYETPPSTPIQTFILINDFSDLPHFFSVTQKCKKKFTE